MRRTLHLLALPALLAGLSGCPSERRPPNNGYPPPGQPGYPPGPGYPQAPPPQGPPPPVGPGVPPPAPQPQNLPPVFNDPINAANVPFFRQRSQGVLQELVAALPANHQSAVQSVPLVVDDTVGEVNAFAACTGGKALMAISDGLMQIQAQMARARATDEIFGTRKFDAYVQFIAQNQRPQTPIAQPPANFWQQQQDTDGRKVKRQHELFDEELAFVLGHELAHHYLQHTGCVGAQLPIPTPADLGRVLSRAVPGFNQPNEITADTNGVTNLLDAGRRRNGYHWTEGGAMLTLNFFEALKTMTPAESILFGFEISHPHPAVRRPIIQQAAANWRAGGGRPAFPFPIPGLGG